MRFIYIIGIGFLLPFLSKGQDIVAHTERGVAVIDHVVSKGQNLQTIANRYKVKVADLTKVNKLNANAVIKNGAKIKVPIAGILKQNCAGSKCVKVYHKVQQSEGLYKIGAHYGNLKPAQLKKMNNLSKDAVSLGQKILVGYLPVLNTNNSPVASEPAIRDVALEQHTLVEEEEPAAMEEPNVIVDLTNKNVRSVEASTVSQSRLDPNSRSLSSVNNNLLQSSLPFILVNNNISSVSVSDKAGNEITASYKKGFFADQFNGAMYHVSGKAGFFKSESGWADGKYYILMDDAQPGDVVKISIPLAPGSTIFAKVVGPLPQVKENQGIRFRLNDAAANVLGVGNQTSFQVNIWY